MKNDSQKWLAVVGSRAVDREVLLAARRKIREKLRAGYAIVSGGSTGIDHEAARLAYDFAKKNGENLADKLRIFLPQEFNLYLKNFRERVKVGKADVKDVAKMARNLRRIYRDQSAVFVENPQFRELDAESFWFRDKQIAEFCDEMICFRVNQSPGTTATINFAKDLGKPVEVFDF